MMLIHELYNCRYTRYMKKQYVLGPGAPSLASAPPMYHAPADRDAVFIDPPQFLKEYETQVINLIHLLLCFSLNTPE